jgi:hypothetical protein
MTNIVDNYYGFPEEEIFDDPNMTDDEKKEALGSLLKHQREYFTVADLTTPPKDPLRTVEHDVLALILYLGRIDARPPEDEDGSKYKYWCNILRDCARRQDSQNDDTTMVPKSWAQKHTPRPRPDYNFYDVKMTPGKQDIDLAKKIIDYYKIKLSHRALTGDIPLSEYEVKLGNFINTKPNQFKFDELGVAVRLPETYNVDLIFDGFIKDYDSLPPYEPEWITTPPIPRTKKSLVLNFIRKVDILGSKQANIRYYFECDKELYCMKFPENNSLLNVLDVVLENNNNILKISAAKTPTVLYVNSKFWYNMVHDGWILEN